MTEHLGGERTFQVAPSPPVRLSLDLGDLQSNPGEDVVVSPDGRTFAVAAAPGEGERAAIWVRAADDADFRSLPGTGGASARAFSSDGESLVYAVPGDHELAR